MLSIREVQNTVDDIKFWCDEIRDDVTNEPDSLNLDLRHLIEKYNKLASIFGDELIKINY